MATVSRPESSELDAQQMRELADFFSHRTPEELRKDLVQTVGDALADPGSHTSGGTPANTTKAHNAIQSELERKENNK